MSKRNRNTTWALEPTTPLQQKRSCFWFCLFSERFLKKIPHAQGKRRSSRKMVGGVKSCLESNAIPFRDARSVQTKPYAQQDPETRQRLSQTCLCVFECLLQRCGSAVACCRGRGSGCSSPGCGINPLGGGRHLPHHRVTEQTTHKLQNNYTK